MVGAIVLMSIVAVGMIAVAIVVTVAVMVAIHMLCAIVKIVLPPIGHLLFNERLLL